MVSSSANSTKHTPGQSNAFGAQPHTVLSGRKDLFDEVPEKYAGGSTPSTAPGPDVMPTAPPPPKPLEEGEFNAAVRRATASILWKDWPRTMPNYRESAQNWDDHLVIKQPFKDDAAARRKGKMIYEYHNRKKLYDWMIDVLVSVNIEPKNMTPEDKILEDMRVEDILYRAYNILDKFMAEHSLEIAFENLVALGGSCLCIAFKYSKPGWQKLEIMSHLADYIAISELPEGQITPENENQQLQLYKVWLENVRKWELQILQKLEFEMVRPTLHHHLCYVQLECWDVVIKEREKRRYLSPSPANKQMIAALNALDQRIGMASSPIGSVLIDPEIRKSLCGHKPAVVALAMMFCALDPKSEHDLGSIPFPASPARTPAGGGSNGSTSTMDVDDNNGPGGGTYGGSPTSGPLAPPERDDLPLVRRTAARAADAFGIAPRVVLGLIKIIPALRLLYPEASANDSCSQRICA